MKLKELPHHHPVWGLLRVVTLTLCACLVLYVTATNFDATEITALAGITGSAAVIEFAKRKLFG
jgi:hypothetical protein